ncbi:MAG: GNAT family N-acetyltransferase [Gemmatimonadetes bacterium]|jgi:GNAT superfamily N-acetyltransferase|nr:GNAT family N-acetyltransferase [Gemmatimonadota bacterium]
MYHRKIRISEDRQAVLELHCEINYACDSPWIQAAPYPAYRRKWIESQQPEGFLKSLERSLEDHRTIAEVWCEGDLVCGYCWATFTDVPDYNLVIAEIHDLAVHRDFRRRGLGDGIIAYLEQVCRSAGAHVLRSGTGAANPASIAMHEKHGFGPYRVEYEKLLTQPSIEWPTV